MGSLDILWRDQSSENKWCPSANLQVTDFSIQGDMSDSVQRVGSRLDADEPVRICALSQLGGHAIRVKAGFPQLI